MKEELCGWNPVSHIQSGFSTPVLMTLIGNIWITLSVSLIKAFAYSGPDSILALGEGETYIWVVDSKFTNPPEEFDLRIGIERLYFDISGASIDLISSLIQALTLGIINPGADQSGITFASISAPYAIEITNPGGGDCPERYSPDELLFASHNDINCGVSAGFGYLHFSPPDDNGARDLWELSLHRTLIPSKQTGRGNTGGD